MNYKTYRNESTRLSLLQAVGKGGDEAAWARFFDTYAGYVFAIARRRGLQETDADEIVQSVFLSLQKKGKLDGYDPKKGAFHSWLAGLTVWRINDLFRKRAAESRKVTNTSEEDLPFHASASMNPVEEIFEEEWRETVRQMTLLRLREKINPVHFSIFHALFFEELDMGVVMQIYGVSRNNLYQIRSRTRAAFGRLLKEVTREMEAPAFPGKGQEGND